MIDRSIVQLFGVSMHGWTMEETVRDIQGRMEKGLFTQQVVVNAGKLVNMQSDMILHESVSSCDIVNVDGAGVVAVGKMFGLGLPERVTGIDLFYQLLSMAEKNHYSVYFLGAEKVIVDEAVRVLRKDYPELEVAGSHHGYFWEKEEAVVQEISTSGADMLFVAIQSPKKENFINKWHADLGVKYVMGVGGTFDVTAGKVKRAPQWMQDYALEWLYRVIQEPRRLWKRYLFGNCRFLCMVTRAFFDKDYRIFGGGIRHK